MITVMIVLVQMLSNPAQALDNGLGLLPKMGWSSWNAFGCSDAMNETSIYMIADFMASSGLQAAGYDLVALDDCMVAAERNSSGFLVPDPDRFPSGFTSLSKYLTSRGFDFGVYEDRGLKTCAKRAGSYGHWYQDATQYKEWNATWLKYDDCNDPPGYDLNTYYLNEQMAKALNESGHRMWFYIKNDLMPGGYASMSRVSNSHRIGNDIKPLPSDTGRTADALAPIQRYSGPGSWNDADSLEIGSPIPPGHVKYPGLSLQEQKIQMQLFSIATVPLIAGFDFNITEEQLAILKNKNSIAINQDPLAVPGQRLHNTHNVVAEVWAKPLADGSFAGWLWNRNHQYEGRTYSLDHGIWLDFEELGFEGSADVFDIWPDPPVHMGKHQGFVGNQTLPVGDSMFLKIVPVAGEHVLTGQGFWGYQATRAPPGEGLGVGDGDCGVPEGIHRRRYYWCAEQP